MLVCRYTDGGRRSHGRVELDHDVAQVVPIRYDESAGRWFTRSGRARPLNEITLLPPAEPSKIACLALNWAGGKRPAGIRHARAADSAVVLKPPSSLTGPGVAVVHPGARWELRHEAELAVVIRVRCANVPAEYAADVVAGFTCADDITAYARPLPGSTASQLIWAKHFDGCTPLGPWLCTDLDPADVDITCAVDGETRQHGSTSGLGSSVPDVIALVSEHMTLMPGDVILTGTPPGSGPLVAGNRVEVSVAGIGVLRHGVEAPHRMPWTPGPTRTGAGGLSIAGHSTTEGDVTNHDGH